MVAAVPLEPTRPVASPVHDALDAVLAESAPVLVAFSGGVDSAFLMARAHAVLGRERCCAVLADSPSLARSESDAARRLAAEQGWNLRVVATAEFDDPSYVANSPQRCFFCKSSLFETMRSLAAVEGWKTLAYGENADDSPAERPGHRAAEAFRVRSPLRETGWTKDAIRQAARAMGLGVADKPASPCLSSRIPHGTPITAAALERIELAEQALREMGFRIFRVRHHGQRARLEFARDEWGRYHSLRPEILVALHRFGYTEVELNPTPYGEREPPLL